MLAIPPELALCTTRGWSARALPLGTPDSTGGRGQPAEVVAPPGVEAKVVAQTKGGGIRENPGFRPVGLHPGYKSFRTVSQARYTRSSALRDTLPQLSSASIK
jgi:hypothetical protein